MKNIRLEFRNVTKRFSLQRGNKSTVLTAVQEISFSLQDAEVLSLIGPSGCGKSTLLNMGSGLYQPSDGEVFVDGEKVDAPNSHVGSMLQKDLLLPWRTICENTEIGLEIQRVPKKQRKKRAMDLLSKCGLSGFEDNYPYQLSGGMRQRAAMARTLAVDPTVLLMDEPFSALDAQTKMILQQDLAETLAAEKKTAFFITHDLAEAVTLSDRILVMSPRPGKIIEEIVVDLPDRDNPMRRRRDYPNEVGGYLNQLMELLQVDQKAHQI